jgi:hypothetical protein
VHLSLVQHDEVRRLDALLEKTPSTLTDVDAVAAASLNEELKGHPLTLHVSAAQDAVDDIDDTVNDSDSEDGNPHRPPSLRHQFPSPSLPTRQL